MMMLDEFDTMATLNNYFDSSNRVKNSWAAIKKRFEELQFQNDRADEYIQVLENKVKALSAENYAMKEQIDTKKQMIQKANAELDVESSYFCGALY